MKKSILLTFAVLVAASVMAQSQSELAMRVWENNVVTYQAPVDNVDSITYLAASEVGDALIGDLITGVTPIMEDGVEIGHKITFLRNAPINIYNGKDGKNGVDGKDGVDGTNGTNGTNGIDGITPKLKIEEDYWWVSYDGGETWAKLNKAKGDKGDKGDSMFKSVTQDENAVYFMLITGETFEIAKHQTLFSPEGYKATGTKNGYQYVDLGLPSGTKWATCNVGSNIPAGRGYMYAWGETILKSVYNESTYTLDYSSLPNNISGTQYDVATVKLGAPWHIPTKNQLQELMDNCTFTYITLNEGEGFLVTGPNGNSITLPCNDTPSHLFYYISDEKGETKGGTTIWSLTMKRGCYDAATQTLEIRDRVKESCNSNNSYTNIYYYGGCYIRPVWNE